MIAAVSAVSAWNDGRCQRLGNQIGFYAARAATVSMVVRNAKRTKQYWFSYEIWLFVALCSSLRVLGIRSGDVCAGTLPFQMSLLQPLHGLRKGSHRSGHGTDYIFSNTDLLMWKLRGGEWLMYVDFFPDHLIDWLGWLNWIDDARRWLIDWLNGCAFWLARLSIDWLIFESLAFLYPQNLVHCIHCDMLYHRRCHNPPVDRHLEPFLSSKSSDNFTYYADFYLVFLAEVFSSKFYRVGNRNFPNRVSIFALRCENRLDLRELQTAFGAARAGRRRRFLSWRDDWIRRVRSRRQRYRHLLSKNNIQNCFVGELIFQIRSFSSAFR